MGSRLGYHRKERVRISLERYKKHHLSLTWRLPTAAENYFRMGPPQRDTCSKQRSSLAMATQRRPIRPPGPRPSRRASSTCPRTGRTASARPRSSPDCTSAEETTSSTACRRLAAWRHLSKDTERACRHSYGRSVSAQCYTRRASRCGQGLARLHLSSAPHMDTSSR